MGAKGASAHLQVPNGLVHVPVDAGEDLLELDAVVAEADKGVQVGDGFVQELLGLVGDFNVLGGVTEEAGQVGRGGRVSELSLVGASVAGVVFARPAGRVVLR